MRISAIVAVLAMGLAIGYAACSAVLPAAAQAGQCFERGKLIELARKRYREVPVWEGSVNHNGAAFESVLLQSPKGTWTFIILVGTKACVLATGVSGTAVEVGTPA